MERIDNDQQPVQHRRHGGLVIGLALLLIGVGWLMRQMSFPFPDWVFSWEMILIVVGLAIGVKNNFRDAGWFILILIGGIFLIRDIFPFLTFSHYFWPIVLILFGVFLIFRPRRRFWGKWQDYTQGKDYSQGTTGIETISSEDYLDYTAAFGGLKKNILSKNFKGGDVTTIFGGTELNFMQADIQGRATLDATQVFGGTKLIIPAHWEVKSDMTTIFGGIDDKRMPSANVDHSKVLELHGTSIFGGIEIVSY
jgi:predicted membrane protein